MDDPKHRSFPDVADGRPLPPMGYEILEASAGLLDWDGAAELARNLAASGDLIPRDAITPAMAAKVLLVSDTFQDPVVITALTAIKETDDDEV